MNPVRAFRNIGIEMMLFAFIISSSAATFTVTNTLDSGAGSLRQAILDANSNAGQDVIAFNIGSGGPQTINITGDLPFITDPVTIDAWTQPGFSGAPLIELAGGGSGGSAYYALRLQSNNNTIRGLIINRFVWYGIYLEPGSSGNHIEGNWIGTDATGKLNLGMNGNGITVNGGANNLIGGTNAQSRNIISGNTVYGVALFGSSNTVQGNYIGTDVDGTNAIPNGYSFNGTGNYAAGVWVDGSGAIGNLIGGSVPGAGNLISGNVRGIILNTGARSNVVQGNIVGPNAQGTALLSGPKKQITGIYIYGANDNLIGGTNAFARNVISGNGDPSQGTEGNGLYISAASGNIVQGNFVGTDISGSVSLGNVRSGINLEFSGNTNTIGGTVAGSRNIISGNGNIGVMIWASQGNIVQGNFIGTRVDGSSPLGNGGNGVHIYNGSGNSIGGSTAASGNTIAFNGYGVFVAASSGTATGNLIRRNSIFSNSNLGIELFNVNCFGCNPFNDVGDGDSGANNLQNFPVLSGASTSGGSISISGTLNTIANSPFTIEFFASPGLDDTGFGEGKTYIGSTAVVTDGSGNATFNSFFSDAGYTGQFITATATDGAKNTSEFSGAVVTDGPAGAIQFSDATYSVAEGVPSATINVVRLAGSSGTVSVHFTTSDGTAVAGNDYSAASGVLTLPDGEVYASFTVPILNDNLNETDETVTLTLDSPSGGVIVGSRSNAVLVISDNDPIYLNAGDAAVTKPASGATTMMFPLFLSGPSSRTVSVSYKTTNITAEAGIDYVSATGRVDFAPGTTNQFVSVTILGDGLTEGSKSFLLSLSNPTNAVFGDSQALGTIYDGTQGVLQLSSPTYTVSEQGQAATITVSRVGGTLGTVSVSFNASNGSAMSGYDFTATNGVLTFNNGQATRTFTIPVLDDSLIEGDETVSVQLSAPSGTTLGDPATAALLIQDDDFPQLSIQPSVGSVVLFWPTQAVDFQLEKSFVASSTNWTAVTNTPGTVGAQFALTNTLGGGCEFFRLRR